MIARKLMKVTSHLHDYHRRDVDAMQGLEL
jgi:hypothetical protein